MGGNQSIALPTAKVSATSSLVCIQVRQKLVENTARKFVVIEGIMRGMELLCCSSCSALTNGSLTDWSICVSMMDGSICHCNGAVSQDNADCL